MRIRILAIIIPIVIVTGWIVKIIATVEEAILDFIGITIIVLQRIGGRIAIVVVVVVVVVVVEEEEFHRYLQQSQQSGVTGQERAIWASKGEMYSTIMPQIVGYPCAWWGVT